MDVSAVCTLQNRNESELDIPKLCPGCVDCCNVLEVPCAECPS